MQDDLQVSNNTARRPTWQTLTLLGLLCLGLYLPGIRWGLPAVVSWSQDTIAGVRTLGAVATWPQAWSGRYPPLHYLVTRIAYEPLLSHWRNAGTASNDSTTGQLTLQPPHAPKIGSLILISRLLSTVMAVSAVMLLWAATASLTGDPRAATLASVAFGGGAAFNYFAHLGNVDVPSIFWFAGSLVFYVRSIKTRSSFDALFLGVFGSLCISTKDSWAGIYPGMAVMLVVEEWRFHRRPSRPPNANAEFRDHPARGGVGPLLDAMTQRRWLIGIAAFVGPYALLNGIPWNLDGWVHRLRALADTLERSEYRHPHALSLAVESIRQAATAVGWPMVAALIAACGYGLWRRPRWSLMLLVPCATYYVIVIARIGFVYERFLLGPLMLLSVLVGIMLANWLGQPRSRTLVRFGLPLAIFVPTIGYAVAVNLEMITDSRYAAEEWFDKAVPRSANVGALTSDLTHFAPQYLPRVHEKGYATFPVLAERESFDRPQPDYLILSSYDYQDFTPEQKTCIDALMSAGLGYQPVAAFRGRFLGTGSSSLSVAGWHAPPPGKISPTLTVFRRSGSAP